jgi:hypothetical protein
MIDAEKLIREYDFREDLDNLNQVELLNKYGESKDKAIYFMHMFTEVFVKRTFYPAMIYREYEKIKNVLNELNEQYTKGTEFESIYEDNIKRIKMEESFARTCEDRTEVESQLYFAKSQELGLCNLNRYIRFNELNKICLDTTKKLTEAYEVNPHFPNKIEYEHMLKEAETIGLTIDPMEEIAMISTYRDYFPLLDLCHDTDTLIGINNLLKESDFTDKEELAGIALNVIDFSLSYSSFGKYFDEKEYKKVAKATTTIIKENEKKKKKAKVKSLK